MAAISSNACKLMAIKAITSGPRHLKPCDRRRMISGRPERDVRNEFTIFSGSANPTLAATIARELGS